VRPEKHVIHPEDCASAVLAGYDVVIRGNDARHDKSLLQSAAVHVAG